MTDFRVGWQMVESFGETFGESFAETFGRVFKNVKGETLFLVFKLNFSKL